MTVADDRRAPDSDAPAAPPRLADGVELVGEFRGSGFKEPPFLVRRIDGQPIQLPRILFGIAEQIDGSRDYAAIAAAAAQRAGVELGPGDVKVLVEERLRPLGILANPDGSSPELIKPDPFLALKFRKAVVSERAVRFVTGAFHPLFWPPVIVAVLAAFVAFDVWLFGVHGVAQGVRESLYQPAFLLVVVGLVMLSAGFHELGHAAACRYGGATPGVMGAGIYVAWPAFYTDVTDSYRLGRGGRLRTDLGGVYFNVVFVLATAGLYFATGLEALLVVIVIQHFEIVHQLLPFVRLDGYYILTDLTGVPDLFSRVRPILRSLLPWTATDPRVAELKPWARALATGWVIVVVPLLLFNLAVLAVSAPRIFATAWDSAGQQLDRIGDAGAVEAVSGLVQVALLAIPVVGIALTFALLARRLGVGAWRATDERPLARAGLATTALAAAAFLAFTWLPDGDYEPIRRGERGLLQDYAAAVARAGSGRAGVVPLERSAARGEVAPPSAAEADVPSAPAEEPGATTTSEPSSTTSSTDRSSTTSTPTTTTTTPRTTTTTTTPRTTTTTASTP